MQFIRLILLVAFTTTFVTNINAQRRRPHGTVPIVNGIGISGGLTQFDFQTDNFETKAGNGWAIAGSATVDLPHKWYNMSYMIQIAENNVGIAARSPLLTSEEFIDYKIFTAQISLLMHVKIIGPYLTFDIGPMLQYNGDMELKDDDKEIYVIKNYESSGLLAKDISDISKFNIDGTVGLSAGISHFRIKAAYIYGFLNTFNKLNDNNLNVGNNISKFKGNQSMFVFSLMISI
ncbi:hypothetical protein C1T31_01315 [Hanstruepera neustonica]|uniref:Outer membrane protein beta-barrel domain-containing protein n=1 Tax=Hanstruepera neustonica TaxID=1445657 RepID=A0A2K1E3E4_9FLAO|nr:hypothetical protein [Hanstruepera neustonica]PNQ74808.1 hypothetical protein C1T31_01315 [Hanstruepera neustonica]